MLNNDSTGGIDMATLIGSLPVVFRGLPRDRLFALPGVRAQPVLFGGGLQNYQEFNALSIACPVVLLRAVCRCRRSQTA